MITALAQGGPRCSIRSWEATEMPMKKLFQYFLIRTVTALVTLVVCHLSTLIQQITRRTLSNTKFVVAGYEGRGFDYAALQEFSIYSSCEDETPYRGLGINNSSQYAVEVMSRTFLRADGSSFYMGPMTRVSLFCRRVVTLDEVTASKKMNSHLAQKSRKLFLPTRTLRLVKK